MSNVIPFASKANRLGTAMQDEPDYTIAVRWTPNGFDWQLFRDESRPDVLPEDVVAADLAAIALSLLPPRPTFLERLRFLFTGDP